MDRVAAFLLEKGAEINKADSRGFTALDNAENRAGATGNTIDVSAGRADAAKVLLAKGGKAGTPIPQPTGRPGGR